MIKLMMDRVSCHVTAKCNLRCKRCAVYIPRLYELGNVPEYSIEDIKKSFQTYFDLVEHVRLISLTGGEPMLYQPLAELIEFLRGYEPCFDKLEVFTNGSLKIQDPVLTALSKSEKMILFVDNYGSEISPKILEIEQQCKIHHVRYQIRTYYGKDMHLGGWVDRSILPERLSEEKAKEHFSKCVVAKPGGRLYTIFGKFLAFCATPFCGYRIGAIPESDVLGVNLVDPNTTLEEKYNQFVAMDGLDYNPGCAWCNGLGIYQDVERFIPGEQVKNYE